LIEGSLKWNKEEVRPNTTPPPKKKINKELNSLLADIENKNFESLKISVKDGAHVKYVGNFHCKKDDKTTWDYEEVPCLFTYHT
jgi:outer membrane lipoprotein-sorting protein